MLKKAKSKVIGILVIAVMALTSVCFGVLNWSYLVDCTNALREVDINWFQKGLECYGSTLVEPTEDAGVTVFLKTLDSEGDWVTVTAWEDVENATATVDVDYAVSDGTYKLEVMHKAYEKGDHSVPLEIHYTESVVVTIGG